ncbi:hypothetical protein PR003_g2710 [Phytophthora rubi]|uniref:Uncharacterized protein n=1 Tax=Phytophthora rubi TaxID=129364 RepID=A0A6A4FRZ9_9STRA|nr:hypothetical protein PR003_g2710 [Phytophthora rubi]
MLLTLCLCLAVRTDWPGAIHSPRSRPTCWSLMPRRRRWLFFARGVGAHSPCGYTNSSLYFCQKFYAVVYSSVGLRSHCIACLTRCVFSATAIDARPSPPAFLGVCTKLGFILCRTVSLSSLPCQRKRFCRSINSSSVSKVG